MPGLRVDCGDHPLMGDAFSDAPTPIGAIGSLGRLEVLSGHQRQKRQRLPAAGPKSLPCQTPTICETHHSDLAKGRILASRRWGVAALAASGCRSMITQFPEARQPADCRRSRPRVPRQFSILFDHRYQARISGSSSILDQAIAASHSRIRGHVPHLVSPRAASMPALRMLA